MNSNRDSQNKEEAAKKSPKKKKAKVDAPLLDWTFEDPPNEYILETDTDALDRFFYNRILKELEIVKNKAVQMSKLSSTETGSADSILPTFPLPL